ncbi:GPW/gp25 family protein [Streptomyces sp. NPDC059985]|uniref:GPW/gp25 family protein n=1 Tax=Streptomyces sp. NPDC059985 TaxID=3347025 RepID=UPI0036901290
MSGPRRDDMAFPFQIAGGSRRARTAGYPEHVDQLLRQLLLTDPGERVALPEFGCGLRRLVFAAHSEALEATVRLQVTQAVRRWLSDQVRLTDVAVRSGTGADPDAGLAEGELLVSVSYVLLDTLGARRLDVKVA